MSNNFLRFEMFGDTVIKIKRQDIAGYKMIANNFDLILKSGGTFPIGRQDEAELNELLSGEDNE